MTPGGRPAQAPIPGRCFAVGDRVVVVVPLPTSLPIPLGVPAPAGIEMLTWAFAGLASDDPIGPRALLVLAAANGADIGRSDLTIATHFRDIPVSLAAPEPVDVLAAEDRALLARAVLSAVSPIMAGHLAGLVDLIGSVPEPASDAPEIAFETADACTLGGTATPNYLLLRSGDAWALARVASARLELGETPRALLALDTLWGAPASAPDAAIALDSHGFTPLRIGPTR